MAAGARPSGEMEATYAMIGGRVNNEGEPVWVRPLDCYDCNRLDYFTTF